MSDLPSLQWTENDATHTAAWRSAAGHAPPKRVVIADDTTPADTAWRLACEGTALLWRGDFQNARQLLSAIARRIDRKPRKPPAGADAPTRFHLYRQAQAQRARTLGMLLVALDAQYALGLRRAPEVATACTAAWGAQGGACVVSLRELLGVVGAHQWRLKGVAVAALGARIHPHYGVFSPVRGEYVELVARAPLPADTALAVDVGTGSGVLAAVLARRGVARVVATDVEPAALACARDNIDRLGLGGQIEVADCDLFAPLRAPLVVCNPPWLPGRPGTPLERAIYDPDSRMLRAFLDGLAAHLSPGGEGWLGLSDLAEHLGLRTRDALSGWIAAAGLRVLERLDTRPVHPRARDASDPLHAARAAEVTSLWRLAAA